MPNLSKLYHDITTVPVEELPQEEILTTGQAELKFNWLNSTVTQELYKKLIEDEKELLNRAIVLATSPQPDHMRIIQILVRVDTLRRLQKEFLVPNTKPKLDT